MINKTVFTLALLALGLLFRGMVLAAPYVVAQNHPHASDDGPGTAAHPWKTISHAAQTAKVGDTVLIQSGVYREMVTVKSSGTAQSPIRFQPAPGAHVVLTGADLLSGLDKADAGRPIYSAAWPFKFNTWSKEMTHPDGPRNVLIGRSEQVFVNGYPLRQVLSRETMAPGTFFADTDHERLYVWDFTGDNLTESRVEASARQEILHVSGDYVQIRGLQFRYAANRAQQGAVQLEGKHDLLEDCAVSDTNADGAVFLGTDITIRRCAFRDNGQLGFSADRAHRLLFTQCLVENNNTKNFERGWEAGGDKLVLTRDAVLEKSRFLRNRGTGIWFDIGNENCTVRNCLIADNEDAGIFYEISYGLHAHDNVIVGNGFTPSGGAWGAQAGICLSSSPNGVIERNLLIGNKEGFDFREQTRDTSRIDNDKGGPVWNHDEVIRNNVLAYNRDAQVWGWFDMNDDREWPKGDPKTARAGKSDGKPAADLAAAYKAGEGGQPLGLSLETLRLQFVDNVYAAGATGEVFNWGVTWKHNERYKTPKEARTRLGIEKGGVLVAPGFRDMIARDLRIPKTASPVLKRSYPQGSVPGVVLGTF